MNAASYWVGGAVRALVGMALGLWVLLAPRVAVAAPEAGCSLSFDQPQTVLGATVGATLTVENTGDAIGFGPAVDLLVPADLVLLDARAFGASLHIVEVASPGQAQAAANPLSGVVVDVPANTAYWQVRVPLSALAPGAPTVEVDLDFAVSTNATLFVPLEVNAFCEYAFGATPDNDADNDPPVVSGAQTSSVTPTALTIAVGGGGTICTGPGSPVSFQVTLDAAETTEIAGARVTALVDDRIRIDSVTITTGSGTVIDDATGLFLPGRSIEVQLDDFIGADGPDVVVEVVGHVPEDAAGVLGEPILDPVTGATVVISQPFTVSDAAYRASPSDPLVDIPEVSEDANVTARSVHLTQSIVPGSGIPGDVVEVELQVCTSEFFAFTTTELVTVLGDGLTYEGVTIGPSPSAVGDDPTTLTVDVGPLGPGSSATVRYSVSIDESYLGGAPLLSGDQLPVTSDLAGSVDPSGSTVSDGASGSVSVTSVGYEKELVAVNGTPVGGPITVRTGDLLTFQLTASVESGDVGGIVLTDFLPAPFLLAEEHGLSPVLGGGIRVVAGPNPASIVVSPSTASNSLTFEYDAIDTQPSGLVDLVLEIDYTVADSPLEDGTVFANLLVAEAAGSSQTQTTVVGSPISVASPKLNLSVGIVATNNPGSTLTLPPVLPPGCDSSTLVGAPFDSDLLDADAGDQIRVAIAIENRGGSAAEKLAFAGRIPAGLGLPTNVVAQTCDGSGRTLTTTMLGQDFEAALTGPLAELSSSGDNVLVVTYDLTLPVGVSALQVLEPDAYIAFYTGRDFSLSNYVGLYRDVTEVDFAEVAIADFTLDKTLSGGAQSATIQDILSYSVIIQVPEGTHPAVVLTDDLPPELALVAAPTVTLSSGVTAETETLTVDQNGGRFTLEFGQVVNANTVDAVAETIVVEFDAVISNNADANRNDEVRNRASLARPGSGELADGAETLTIEEPRLEAVFAAPQESEGGDTVVFSVVVRHLEDSRDAHEVVFTSALPAGVSNLTDVSHAGGVAPTSIILDGESFTVTWDTLPVGQQTTIEFSGTVDLDVAAGSLLALAGQTTWTGQPGDGSVSVSEYDDDSVERTGAGGVDDYLHQSGSGLPIQGTNLIVRRITGGPVPVGGTVVFEVDTFFPTAVAANYSIDLTLDAGLALVALTNFQASADLTCDGGSCSLPTPDVTSNGRVVSLDFGDVENPDEGPGEFIRFRVESVVINSSAIAQGSALGASASDGIDASESTKVLVIEPDVRGFASITGGADAADVVTVTLMLRHESGSTAYEPSVTVTLPPWIVGNPGTFDEGSCTGAVATVISDDEAVVDLASLSPGAACDMTFLATLTEVVGPMSTYDSPIDVTWTSLSGDVGAPQSPYEPLSVERTGEPSDPGEVNDYRYAFASEPIVTPFARGDKRFVRSLSPTTIDPALAVGETAIYSVAVTLPEGTAFDVSVVEMPPPGLEIVAVSLDTAGFAGAIGTSPVGLVGGGSGVPTTATLGTVVTFGDNVPTNDTFHVVFVTRVVLDPAAQPGSLNRAEIRVGGLLHASYTAPVVFATPQGRIALEVSETAPVAEQVVTFTASVSSLGAGPVCRPQVQLTLPAGFTMEPPASDGIDNDGNGLVDDAAEAIALGATYATTFDACLSTGQARNLTVLARAHSDIPPGAVQATAQLFGYETLRVGGIDVDPLDDLFDNDGNGSTDEVGDGVVEVTLAPVAPALTFEKTVTSETVGAPAEAEYFLDYVVTLRNTGTGPATNVVVSDVLPGSTTLVEASATVGAVGSGSTVTWTLPSFGAGQTEELSIRVQLDDFLTCTTVITNQATLAANFGYGGLVTDDPNTPAVDDGTAIPLDFLTDCDGDGIIDPEDPDPTNPNVCGDSDGDTCDDCSQGGRWDPDDDGSDGDGDGLCDDGETGPETGGTDPDDADTDDDGIIDGDEVDWNVDSDGDFLINALDPDSDNDGLLDGTEVGITDADLHPDTDTARGHYVADADPLTTTDMTLRDTDDGGVMDGAEDWNRNGRFDEDDGETDPNVEDDDGDGPDDTDGDGLPDIEELELGSDPNDRDTDDDGVIDGREANPTLDTDGDGYINILDPDSDNEGMFDGTEQGITTPDVDTDVSRKFFVPDANPSTKTSPLLRDTDYGGLSDRAEDPINQGAIDEGESDPLDGSDDAPLIDTDGDGLLDVIEIAEHTDRLDRDTDDDGVIDGDEVHWNGDSDGDGVINALDPDSDNDGLRDGTEMSIVTPDADTDTSRGFFVADAHPASSTDPTHRDTDRGGVPDGAEDFNLDGAVGIGELNPLDPSDDVNVPLDDDNDGLSSDLELFIGTDPLDADSDDDGVIDGLEPNFSLDTDGDGDINALDPDSDAEGLFDGTELGVTTPHEDTDVSVGVFVPDVDPTTKTSALLADTDFGSVSDRIEDSNGNGRLDQGERNPLDPSDDIRDEELLDSDGDGLLDVEEIAIGTDPFDADSDDDGVPDGEEPNINVDSDGDGLINALDPDSDGDAICDGTELGYTEPHADTDLSKRKWVPDGDPTTSTSATRADTDRGSVGDGIEDPNHDGVFDEVETDPLFGDDDDGDLDSDGDTIRNVDEGLGQECGESARDTDDDGTPDYLDLDSDDDGIPDSEEAGDADLSTPPVDFDDDGTPDFQDPDIDDDGVEDGDDNCLTTPNEDQLDTDEDGEGDACDDRDDDGVLDIDDNCPDDENTKQDDDDDDGIGDVCDDDADGDGWFDDAEASGGACTVGVPGAQRPPGALLVLVGLGLVWMLRRRRRSALALASLGSFLAYEPEALAQSEEPAQVGVERFRLSTDRDGLLDTEWAAAIPHLAWVGSAWLGYANAPYVLTRPGADGGREDLADLVGYRVGGGLGGALGLFGWLQVGVELPFAIAQGRGQVPVGPDASLDDLQGAGFGDLRVAPKAQFLRTDQHGVDVSVTAGMVIPLGTPNDYLRERFFVFQPELAVSRAFGGHRLSANLGYRIKEDTEFLGLRIGDEVFYHFAYGYRFDRVPLELDATLSGAFLAEAPFAEAAETPLELRAGPVWDVTQHVAVLGAFGVGLTSGYGTPAWRGVIGVRVHGEPDFDRDKDGIKNRDDACPDDPEDFDHHEDEDGCPEEWPDRDGDGYIDPVDQCPDDPEDFDQVEDEDGCPESPPPVQVGAMLVLTDQILFKFDRDEIEESSYPILDEIRDRLQSFQEVTLIEVQGHTDDVGYDWYNLDLSARRARSVKAYLVKKHISSERLSAQGYGESQPIADNSTEEGRARNRRVGFVAREVRKPTSEPELVVKDSRTEADAAAPPAEAAPQEQEAPAQGGAQ